MLNRLLKTAQNLDGGMSHAVATDRVEIVSRTAALLAAILVSPAALPQARQETHRAS
jgi:hypothetical protein